MTKPPKPHSVGPYSKTLRRGVIGTSIDGRSALGRFMRDMEKQLVDHVGGKPTLPQRLLIDRMVKVRVQLDLLDDKLASGEWTPHDSRTYGGLLNAFRLLAREIGIKDGDAAPKTRRARMDAVYAKIGLTDAADGEGDE